VYFVKSTNELRIILATVDTAVGTKQEARAPQNRVAQN
jgi:hypothetical protein